MGTLRRGPGVDRRLIEAVVSLYGIQALSMLLPLIMWPWLARVLGPAQAGVVALSEAAARYVGLFVEYGFQLSATREVAQCRTDAEGRVRVVSAVLSGQALLAGSAAVIAGLAWLIVPSLNAYPELVFPALMWGGAIGLNPVWYFQGTERMPFVAGVEAGCRSAAVLSIILLVHEPGRAWLVPTLSGTAAVAAALINWRELRRESRFRPVSLRLGWWELRAGFQTFLFRGGVSLYTTGNVLLLGIFAWPETVGLFAVAEKLVKAGVSAIYPISQAMYPRIARLVAGRARDEQEARRAVMESLRWTAGLGLLMGLLLALAGGWLVRLLFGPSYSEAAHFVRILSCLAPLIGISNVLGLQWMLPRRMERQMNLILGAGAAVNLLLAWLLAPGRGAEGMSWAVVGAETAITAGVLLSLLRAGGLPWAGMRKQEGAVSC